MMCIIVSGLLSCRLTALLSCPPSFIVLQRLPYERTMMTLVICLTVIILFLIVRDCFIRVRKNDGKPHPVPQEDPRKKMYPSLLEKKLDFRKKLAEMELTRSNGEESKMTNLYLEELDALLEDWTRNFFNDEKK